MIQTLDKVFKALDRVGLESCIGDESLLGLAEGNLEKYIFDPVIYQFPTNLSGIRYIVLTLILYFQGIVVKPKWVHGSFRLKIRGKTDTGRKAANFIFLMRLKKTPGHLGIYEKNRSCVFPESAMRPLEDFPYKDIVIKTPPHLHQFSTDFKKQLFSNTYRTHPTSFDQQTADQAESMLFGIADILNTQRSHWWLEGGTLLGLFRDGKLLDWDHDIDLGLKFESEAQISKLIVELKKTPYYIKILDFPQKEGLWNLGNIRLIKIYPRRFYFFHTDLCLDLFVFYREAFEDETDPVYKYVVHQRNGYHSASILDDLTDLFHKGHRLGRPGQTETFLANKYGDNWSTPVKEWHVAIDDKSILNNMD
ncbi:MAG: LicD family protein [Candidatus Marinimicrobia bacterium]|nr:LicD family protein [Candidatus Neomarinimicrobiota bacterium]